MTIHDLYVMCDSMANYTLFYVIDPDEQKPLAWGVPYRDMDPLVAKMYVDHFVWSGTDEVLIWIS